MIPPAVRGIVIALAAAIASDDLGLRFQSNQATTKPEVTSTWARGIEGQRKAHQNPYDRDDTNRIRRSSKTATTTT